MPPDEEEEERVELGGSGDFETDLKAILGVDPEDLEDGLEEPPQE